MTRTIFLILLLLLLPYVFLFVDGILLAEWLGTDINQMVFVATIFLSTPGLIVVGIVLLRKSRLVDRISGIACIVWAILYLIIYFWALSTSL
jgi:hypothetical protein